MGISSIIDTPAIIFIYDKAAFIFPILNFSGIACYFIAIRLGAIQSDKGFHSGVRRSPGYCIFTSCCDSWYYAWFVCIRTE